MTLRLNGSTSGYTEIDAPAVAGNNTIQLPSSNPTVNGSLVACNTSGAMSFTSDPSITSLNGGALAGTRNRIINGDMRIAQRGTSFASTGFSGIFTLDRWRTGGGGSTAVATISQSTDTPNNTFLNSLRVQVTTADTSVGSTDLALLVQSIEGHNVRDLIGNTFTLSFWVKSPKTGTHCACIRNDGQDRSYVLEYTVSVANTWEYKTLTIIGGLITAGTWNWTNGEGISIGFTLMCGSTYQTTANAWQTGSFSGTANQVNIVDNTANNFYITGVQLEAGSVATPFERRSYGQELALCQRYYQTVRLGSYNNNASSITIGGSITFPVKPRATPTMALLSGSALTYQNLSSTGTEYYSIVAAGSWNVGDHYVSAEL